MRNDGATPRAPLGSGPGDVGPAGAAPPTSTMNVRVIPLEETRFQGVANAAKAETAAERNYRIAQLAVGDCAALLAFAAIGRGKSRGGDVRGGRRGDGGAVRARVVRSDENRG